MTDPGTLSRSEWLAIAASSELENPGNGAELILDAHRAERARRQLPIELTADDPAAIRAGLAARANLAHEAPQLDDEDALLVALRSEGVPYRRIADEAGLTPGQVWARLTKLGAATHDDALELIAVAAQ